MERKTKVREHTPKDPGTFSPVRTVIAWLIDADREFRVAQSMVNDMHDKK